jgi:hypothetical protein
MRAPARVPRALTDCGRGASGSRSPLGGGQGPSRLRAARRARRASTGRSGPTTAGFNRPNPPGAAPTPGEFEVKSNRVTSGARASLRNSGARGATPPGARTPGGVRAPRGIQGRG